MFKVKRGAGSDLLMKLRTPLVIHSLSAMRFLLFFSEDAAVTRCPLLVISSFFCLF